MKKRSLLAILFGILLTSCDISLNLSLDFGGVTPSLPGTSSSSNQENSSSIQSSVNGTSSNQSSESMSSSSSSKPVVTGDREVKLFALNDFHGSIEEKETTSGTELGILKYGTFFKNKGAEDNTLILSSGDMWQGSLESNYNYGALLTEMMNEIEFDAFTLGNHEFDWGAEKIINNRKLKDEDTGYQTPFLAANIYNYNIDSNTVYDHASDLGDKYAIRELENGLKVGIIGVIGEGQISSICSQFVDSYTFLDMTDVIKKISDELRVEKDCDVVILDAHAEVEEIAGSTSQDLEGITEISTISNKRYIDAVFGAHTHTHENYLINNVPFVQSAGNGMAHSEIVLNVDENGEVTCSKYTSHKDDVEEVASITSYDQDVVDLVNKYKVESDKIGNEVLGTVDGYFSSGSAYDIANVAVAGFADFAAENNIDIDYAITNNSRATVNSGTLTYRDLYKALPFDNEVYILEVDGYRITNQASHDSTYIYRVNKKAISTSNKYRIAIIDYLGFHRNDNREYNYFKGATTIGKLEKVVGEMYNYREITADYIRKITSSGKTLNSSEYNRKLDAFNTKTLTSSIS